MPRAGFGDSPLDRICGTVLRNVGLSEFLCDGPGVCTSHQTTALLEAGSGCEGKLVGMYVGDNGRGPFPQVLFLLVINLIFVEIICPS